MGGKIFKITIIVIALPILQTFEMNLTGFLFFSLVNFFTHIGNAESIFELIQNVKLQAPNNVGGIFDISRLLETLKRNGVAVICAIERADDDESGVGFALKNFEFANCIINAVFRLFFRGRDDLQIVDKNYGRFSLTCAQRTQDFQ